MSELNFNQTKPESKNFRGELVQLNGIWLEKVGELFYSTHEGNRGSLVMKSPSEEETELRRIKYQNKSAWFKDLFPSTK